MNDPAAARKPETPQEPRAGMRTPDGSVISLTRPFCGDPQDPYAQNTLVSTQRKRIEINSTGIDDALQGRSGNPYGGQTWVGLRVPAFVNTPATRYLFQLAAFQIPESARARIVGMRQGWTLGLRQANTRVIEQWVEDPFFKLPDGNISWHLRKMPIDYPIVPQPGPFFPAVGFPAPIQNFQFVTSDTSSLLYQSATFGAPSGFYTTLTGYVPPNRGMPWGEPIGGELGTFYDLKTHWRDGNGWTAIDVPVEGPCKIALYASVLQTNPNSQNGRPTVTTPNPFVFTQGLSAEEQFLLNFPTANIWRVAGSLAVELEDYKP